MKSKVAVLYIFIVSTICCYSQVVTTELESRAFVEVGFSPLKDLDVTFAPELRFDDSFKFDKMLLETMVTYKLIEPISVGVQYRFGINPKNSKPTEYYHRYAFQLVGKHSISDFTGSLRIRYANDADEESTDKEYMRYKFGLKYNIPKCKLTPSVGVEAFQQLATSGLHKMRYSGGLSYKLDKKQSVKFKYRFDYHLHEYVNTHILAVGYNYEF